jgi:hypothetical protein
MEKSGAGNKQGAARRSFLKKGALGVGAAAIGAGFLAKGSPVFAQERDGGSLSKGDLAILQLLLAAEIIETDLWQQYKELGGIEVANNPTFQPYVNGLLQLDGDMPQYISDNTDDEISHVVRPERVSSMRPELSRAFSKTGSSSASRKNSGNFC